MPVLIVRIHTPHRFPYSTGYKPRVVAIPLGGLDLVDIHSKSEDVLFAHFFHHFDVGAVQSSDRQRAVQHELHVPGPGRFRT